jgi:chromatin segregation and condensation protein Rec8/ScpA/Scc1 (kleisin family)
MEIEEQIEILYNKMLLMAERENIITYSKIIKGLESLERIKTFVILLFMAQNGKVTLWQEEDLGEIFITMAGG